MLVILLVQGGDGFPSCMTSTSLILDDVRIPAIDKLQDDEIQSMARAERLTKC